MGTEVKPHRDLFTDEISTIPVKVYRVYVDPVGFELVAVCDAFPTLEYQAVNAEHAVAGLLRLIADALESGLIP